MSLTPWGRGRRRQCSPTWTHLLPRIWSLQKELWMKMVMGMVFYSCGGDDEKKYVAKYIRTILAWPYQWDCDLKLWTSAGKLWGKLIEHIVHWFLNSTPPNFLSINLNLHIKANIKRFQEIMIQNPEKRGPSMTLYSLFYEFSFSAWFWNTLSSNFNVNESLILFVKDGDEALQE